MDISSCFPLDLPGLTWGLLLGSPAPDTGSFLAWLCVVWNCFCPLTTLPQAEWPPGLTASVPLSWSLAARSRLDSPSDPHIWDLVLNRAVAGNISILFVTQRVSVDPYSIPRTVLGTVGPLEKRQVWVLPSGWEGCRGGTDTDTRQSVLSAQ